MFSLKQIQIMQISINAISKYADRYEFQFKQKGYKVVVLYKGKLISSDWINSDKLSNKDVLDPMQDRYFSKFSQEGMGDIFYLEPLLRDPKELINKLIEIADDTDDIPLDEPIVTKVKYLESGIVLDEHYFDTASLEFEFVSLIDWNSINGSKN